MLIPANVWGVKTQPSLTSLNLHRPPAVKFEVTKQGSYIQLAPFGDALNRVSKQRVPTGAYGPWYAQRGELQAQNSYRKRARE